LSIPPALASFIKHRIVDDCIFNGQDSKHDQCLQSPGSFILKRQLLAWPMSTAGEMECPASCSTSERSTRRSPVSRLISTSVHAAPKVLYVSFRFPVHHQNSSQHTLCGFNHPAG
jgi:hypothetical protein